jgi:hypothetical protein
MDTTPVPEPYTLPLTIRASRNEYIGFFVIWLLCGGAISLYTLVTTDPWVNLETWTCALVLFAGTGLLFLGPVITFKIRLEEDRISCREWFFLKEMEYSRITAVRFYVQQTEMVNIPTLELTVDSSYKITIGLSMGDTPANRSILYEVLKKNATRAGINKSFEDFFSDPDTPPSWRKGLLPQSYSLPLTLRTNEHPFSFWLIISAFLTAGLVITAIFINTMMNMAGWVVLLVGVGGIAFAYFWDSLPAIRLTEDRISCREQTSWKEMEYTQITVVRFYNRDGSSDPDSAPVLELSGDSGDTITIGPGMFANPGNIWIIYDVLKKKAPQAGLRNSPQVFFYHPEAKADN